MKKDEVDTKDEELNVEQNLVDSILFSETMDTD
jgi:hypothetical protein